MKRIVLMVLSAAAGIVLLSVASHRLSANTTGGMPGDGTSCYYNMYVCAYGDTNAYWDGCDPNNGEGMITTASAKAICKTYHDS